MRKEEERVKSPEGVQKGQPAPGRQDKKATKANLSGSEKKTPLPRSTKKEVEETVEKLRVRGPRKIGIQRELGRFLKKQTTNKKRLSRSSLKS